MTSLSVSSVSEWNTVAGTVSAGDTVTLTSNLTFTSQPTVMPITTATIFKGSDKILTYDFASPEGVFSLSGGTIQNVTVDGDGNTLVNNSGMLLDTTNDQYGTISGCKSTNATLGQYGGGMVGYDFGNDGEDESTLEYCESDVTLASRTGGMTGPSLKNVTISGCWWHGPAITFSTGSFVGGICSYTYSGATVTVTGCQVSSDISGGGTMGGIFGTVQSGTININECYVSGDIGNGAGGLLGRTEGGAGATVNIADCYLSGDVSGSSAYGAGGLICTLNSGSTINVERFYQAGTVSGSWGAALVRTNSGTVNANNGIYVNSTNIVESGSAVSGTVTTTLDDVDGTSLPSGWSTDKWTASGTTSDSDYHRLKVFEDTSKWTGYTSYNSAPSLNLAEIRSSEGGGGGDGGGGEEQTPISSAGYMVGDTVRLVNSPSTTGVIYRVRPVGATRGVVVKYDGTSELKAYFYRKLSEIEHTP